MQGSAFAVHYYPLKEVFDRLPMLWRVGYNPICMQCLRTATLPRIRINESMLAVEYRWSYDHRRGLAELASKKRNSALIAVSKSQSLGHLTYRPVVILRRPLVDIPCQSKIYLRGEAEHLSS